MQRANGVPKTWRDRRGQSKTVGTVTWSRFDGTGWRDGTWLPCDNTALVLLGVCDICEWTRLNFRACLSHIAICIRWLFNEINVIVTFCFVWLVTWRSYRAAISLAVPSVPFWPVARLSITVCRSRRYADIFFKAVTCPICPVMF